MASERIGYSSFPFPVFRQIVAPLAPEENDRFDPVFSQWLFPYCRRSWRRGPSRGEPNDDLNRMWSERESRRALTPRNQNRIIRRLADWGIF